MTVLKRALLSVLLSHRRVDAVRAAAGRHQMPFVTMSAILGGNVRVGLEDSLWLGRGQLAKSAAA